MSGIIYDGTGRMYQARVNSNAELHTRTRAYDQSQLKCVEGKVFILSVPFRTIDTTGGRVAWMQFNDTANYFVLDQLIPIWNGGSTNYNTPLEVEFVLGDTQPTTGTTPWAMANGNTLSNNSLDATMLIWDGSTGSGMTGHTAGLTAGRMIIPAGYHPAAVEGKMIVGPGTTLSVNMKAQAETGVASFTGYYYLIDPLVDV